MIQKLQNKPRIEQTVQLLVKGFNELVDFANSLQGEKCPYDNQTDCKRENHESSVVETPPQIDVKELLSEVWNLGLKASDSLAIEVQYKRFDEILDILSKALTHKV